MNLPATKKIRCLFCGRAFMPVSYLFPNHVRRHAASKGGAACAGSLCRALQAGEVPRKAWPLCGHFNKPMEPNDQNEITLEDGDESLVTVHEDCAQPAIERSRQ